MQIPVQYRTLPNGLRVVVSRDTTAPTVVVAVYYHIGFRIEPEGSHGLRAPVRAHDVPGLPEPRQDGVHQLVQSNGGIFNGSTRFDFTNYFEVVPSNTLETVLWAEADRMRGLAINRRT